MYTVSSACISVFAFGSTPWPNRMRKATRAPMVLSSECTVRPYHSSCSASSVTATVPVGSRQVVVD